jgi:hypothetical protein
LYQNFSSANVLSDKIQRSLGLLHAARGGISKTVGPLMTHGFVLFGFLATPTIRPPKLISIKTSKAAFVIIKPRGREGPKLHFAGALKSDGGRP